MFKRLKKWVESRHVRETMKSESYKLLHNEAFMTAKESLQEGLLQDWVSTKPDDAVRREELKRQYDTVDKVVHELAVLYELKEEDKDDGEQ